MVPLIHDGDEEKAGIESGRVEFRDTCFTTIQALLDKTGEAARGC